MDSSADVLVIGSGQAGVPLATRLAKAGKRVVLFERGNLGGTCVNVGCTPTKTMVASARAAHVARNAARLGVHTGDVKVDLAAVVDRKDAIVARWRSGVERRVHGIDSLRVVRAHARFVAPRVIEAAGDRYSAPAIVLDVGARALVPKVPGLESVPHLDNHTVMDLRELPRHLLVVGGGYIGCEFGQMFRRFGAQVTIVDHATHLLDREDPEISTALESVFTSEGIALELGAAVASAKMSGNDVVLRLANGKELSGSHVLVAVGRRPNTDDLGCDAGGVALDARGFVVTGDDYTTSAEGVYAVGDVDGGPQFTHTAWDDHRLLFERLMGKPTRSRGARLIPFTAFTDPQVAGVGPSEREARERGLTFEVATMPFGNIARAIEIDETAGIMKLLLDPATERVLGARIVGAEAGELIHMFVVLMQANASARAIVDVQCVHPSFAEGVQSLVMRLPRYALS
ncbi:MAG TPA: mercuric reductase [Polyangiaceae bacterium]|jgi:pyruvate/2-oxoglutarate dehydrogenase complex dihydrolipoamide dehydrogenase (E3) component